MITSNQASTIIAAGERRASALGVPVNITVLDAGTHLKAFSRMDGAVLGSIDVSASKARTASALSFRAYQLQQQRERAKKDAEPKDAGWAYSMEMLIRQHIESNLPADRYTSLQIECRTTFCQLKMTGTGAEARSLADQLAREIPRQPWSDMAQKGAGGGSNGDAWHIDYEWFRPRTDSERRAWFGMRDKN